MVSILSWLLLGVLSASANGLEAEGKKFSQLAKANRHFLEGTVYIRDINTIEIRSFSYPSTSTNPNGILGPDSFFIAGTKGCGPDNLLKRGGNTTGIIIPLPFPETGKNWQFEDRSIPRMRKAVNENILLTLPPGVQTSELKWLSLFCRRYRHNFGQVILNDCP
eukprot:TRINITY_DN4204_c0_g1_i2.p1 TRINITY_DN4204_c0_g1~~TRINITY_DN4204_c0_g1_i2.p1  ORF type:complete len:164 (-),score=22.21 TRINITY_DN4204_c0_g1_i2:108-599(-)